MNNELQKIVWLASYPKSGNTWFRIFLSNLLKENSDPVDINEMFSTPIASSRNFFDEKCGVSSADLIFNEIEDLRPEVYQLAASEAEDIIFSKVHDAWKVTPSGREMFPKEVTRAVIYFIRNPLDVAVSFAFHANKAPSEMVRQLNNKGNAFCQKSNRIYNQLKQELSDWSGHVNSWVNESGLPLIVLRYEDMLSDTLPTFQKALRFIGIEKHEIEIIKAIEASSFSKLQAFETKSGFREKPQHMEVFFRKGVSGNWDEHLSNSDVKTLTTKHKSLMEKYGYS